MRTLRLTLSGTVLLAVLVVMSGAVVAQEESEAAAFPTGPLVSVENPYVLLTFNEDGTGEVRDVWMGGSASFVYATHDDLYTEMWNDTSTSLEQVPVTYFWDFDGEQLTMELWGRDLAAIRNMVYADNTWTPIEDPRDVVVASRNVEAGERVPAMMAFAPAAEVGPDDFTATQDVVDRIAAVSIGKFQPITPDMLEPLTEQ